VGAQSTGLHNPPDFNPLEFWLCGHLETSLYSNMINDRGVRPMIRDLIPVR